MRLVGPGWAVLDFRTSAVESLNVNSVHGVLKTETCFSVFRIILHVTTRWRNWLYNCLTDVLEFIHKLISMIWGIQLQVQGMLTFFYTPVYHIRKHPLT